MKHSPGTEERLQRLDGRLVETSNTVPTSPTSFREPSFSRRTHILQDLHKNCQVRVFVERQVTRNSFVDSHSERIAIRGFRGTTVLEPETLRIDELWTLLAEPLQRGSISTSDGRGNGTSNLHRSSSVSRCSSIFSEPLSHRPDRDVSPSIHLQIRPCTVCHLFGHTTRESSWFSERAHGGRKPCTTT